MNLRVPELKHKIHRKVSAVLNVQSPAFRRSQRRLNANSERTNTDASGGWREVAGDGRRNWMMDFPGFHPTGNVKRSASCRNAVMAA